MKTKSVIVVLAVSLSLISSSALMALDDTAGQSLSQGKKLYAEGRYEEAMDRFIDVFVSGNPDQIAQANEYVNLIHFDRGGVVPPKQVPYDKELEKKQNIGAQGKNLFDKKPDTPQKEEELREVPVVNNEIKDVSVEEQVKTPKQALDTQGKPMPVENTPKVEEKEPENMMAAVPVEEKQAEEQKPEENKVEEISPSEPEEIQETEEIEEVQEENTFPKGSKAKIHKLQKKNEENKRLEMRNELLAKLSTNKNLNVYMRGGRVDAIDILADYLFKGHSATINKNASSALDDIYALMILENSPTYFVLPEGSYTDEVTLQGVRQAVALNSYLINRGISSSKMKLNMGLTTQEPPEKFSSLAGISIVFDYEGESTLKLRLTEKNLPPVLSLAIYPFKEITPALDETFVIDFSVIEATAPILKWSLQIVHHAADGHYYVVKQLSGADALTYQLFWNGRKRYFGQTLPAGKYTVVLQATDKEGRERILKRQLILKEAPVQEKPVKKTESEVAKAESEKTAKSDQAMKDKNLDYNQKRLWTKPGKKRMGGVFEDEIVSEETESQSTDNIALMPQEPAVSANTTVSVSEANANGMASNPYETVNNPYDTSYDDEDEE